MRKPECVGGAHARPLGWLASQKMLQLPVSGLNASCRIYDGSRAGYHQVPATVVPLHRTGIESWSYAASPGSGVLVWAQAYDPLWRLSGNGQGGRPLPVQSLLDGYLLGAGQHRGSIAFTGESSTAEGTAVTVCAAVLLLPIAVIRRRNGRHTLAVQRVTPPVPHRPGGWLLSRWRRLLRRTMDFCVNAGPGLLALCPAATMAGHSGLLLLLGLGALLAGSATALLAPAVPVAGPTQDSGTAGLGQDARDQAEPGMREDGENGPGPREGNEPAGPGEGPGPDGEQTGPEGDPAGPGREWVLDGIRG